MRTLVLGAAALLTIMPLQAAARRHIAGRGGPDPVLGVSMNITARPDANALERALDLASAGGAGWVRLQFSWPSIQPSASVADYRLYDQLMARVRLDALRVIGVLGDSPPWNTTAPSFENRSAQREHYPPADYDAWSRFVYTTVTQYKNTVHYWEIWNQPDLGSPADEAHPCNGNWCGTANQYARLLSVAYGAVKSADPTAGVLLGGLALGGPEVDPGFLLDILTDPDYPASASFDIMAFHVYGSTAEALRRMNLVKSQLAYGGVARPIWITEFGYPSDPGRQTVAPYLSGETGQAAYLKDMAAYLLKIGARKILWNQLFDTDPSDPLASYGLLTATLTKKAAYVSFGEVSAAHP